LRLLLHPQRSRRSSYVLISQFWRKTQEKRNIQKWVEKQEGRRIVHGYNNTRRVATNVDATATNNTEPGWQ